MRNESGFIKRWAVDRSNKVELLQELLEKEYGIRTPEQLEKAISEMSKIDISLFLTPADGD